MHQPPRVRGRLPEGDPIDFIAMLNRDYRKARRVVNHAQIDRLLSSVPETTEPRHRKRVHGYATTARRIDTRISTLRVELERALRAVDDAVAEGGGERGAPTRRSRSPASWTRSSASSRAWTPGCASRSAPSPTTRASSRSAKARPRRIEALTLTARCLRFGAWKP